ncbi:MAG TPA: helix-turn-helix transcriptional regulator [Duganella sp.]|nr:helix-turn-helix transcriptional regulator [Duganella sp.]
MDDDMKLSAKTIKRLRTERAWSQEQLAEIADVSLRTIQRVEADGSASRETRMALAAAFDIDVRDLAAPEAAPPESPLPAPAPINATPKRYRVAGVIALLAAIMSAGAMFFSSQQMPSALTTLAPMTAIAGALYAGFGWYFSGRTQLSTPARRTVQFGFITCALVLLFSCFSASPRATATAYLQMMLFACAIRHAFDWYFSRSR